MYLLHFLHTKDWFFILEWIDEIISAELPTPADDPTEELWTIIGLSIVHGLYSPDYAKSLYMQVPGQDLQVVENNFQRAFRMQ